MDRAHILYLINNLSTGGTQRVVSELATHLDPRRFKVSLAAVTATPPERVDRALIKLLEEHGIPIHSLGRQGTQKSLAPLGHLYSLLKEERVDIVHTGVFQPDFYGQIAGALARVPVRVRTFHVTQQWPDSSRWIGTLCEPLLKHLATHNTAVSNACRQSVSRDLGLDPERIQVIPNAVAIPGPRGDRQAVRRNLGFGERPVVAIVGRLAPEKGHRTLLLAAKALADHPRAPLFVVVGDGELRAELQQLVEQWDLRGSVRFLGSRSDMAAIYQAVDIIVNASSLEGLSMTLLESLAAQRTVIASDIPGNMELIHAEDTGLLFPQGSAETLAQALERVLDDPELANRLAQNGYELVRNTYGLDEMVQRYQEIYLKGLRQAGRHVPDQRLRPATARPDGSR